MTRTEFDAQTSNKICQELQEAYAIQGCKIDVRKLSIGEAVLHRAKQGSFGVFFNKKLFMAGPLRELAEEMGMEFSPVMDDATIALLESIIESGEPRALSIQIGNGKIKVRAADVH